MKRWKKSRARRMPLIRLVGLEAAVAVSGVAGSLAAVAAPGDLDPAFGDVGRQSNVHDSSFFDQWSVAVQDDDSVLFGGGGEYCYWGCYEDYFIGRLLPNGSPDASFAAATLNETVVLDTALQPDGKLIGVGRANNKLQVFRLRPDGTLDPEFGLGGLVLIGDVSSASYDGHSVIIDPDGRIVVAGSRNNSLLVARLQANGAMDTTFGTGGVYVVPAPSDFGVYPARIARAAGGGYRVTAHDLRTPSAGGTTLSCNVIGLTDTGAPDTGFGNAGIARAPSANDKPVSCSSMAAQSDGRILLGGTLTEGEQGYLGRLLANGTADPGFHSDAVAEQMGSVSALGVGSAGSIFVAGQDRTGFSGALVVRLLADGTLDTLFGRAGAARVDVQSRRANFPNITDLQVVAKDALVVAGRSRNSGSVFVARLLGDAAGGSPGVLTMKQERSFVTEQGGRAVLSVRRTGGSEGAIAVSYSTRDSPNPTPTGSVFSQGASATSGADYTSTSGRLTWADGDASERQVEVPIASDTLTEQPEFFEVVLDSPEGGAGLGALGADVEIAGSSYPVGQFSIQASAPTVSEGESVSFYVNRDFYGQGAVSVTVRVVAGGSATPGQDFHSVGSSDWQDAVLTWSDGEIGSKFITVQVTRDNSSEPTESFTLELASPTGGASLGVASQASATVLDLPLPPPPSNAGGGNSRSGGGSLGWLSAMLFGLWGAYRRRSSG